VDYNFSTESSIGLGRVWSIRPAFAASILHKNDKQLARNIDIASKHRYDGAKVFFELNKTKI